MACTRAPARRGEERAATHAAVLVATSLDGDAAAVGERVRVADVADVADAGAAPLVRVAKSLRNPKLRDPMPGGWLGGWAGDTGIDIAGNCLPVYALAAGTLDYAEWGHTRWRSGRDTAFSVRIAFDEPIPWGTKRITHAYYTHLSSVVHAQPELPKGSSGRIHVEAGERIATSGIGNGTPHLHLGLLLDDDVEQESWDFILREHEIRKVLGGYRNGERLPLTDAP